VLRLALAFHRCRYNDDQEYAPARSVCVGLSRKRGGMVINSFNLNGGKIGPKSRRFWKRNVALLALGPSVLAFSGCASTQLNYDTVEIASTIDNVYTKQALNNLSKFIDDPFAIPSQVLMVGGTIQTTNTIQPSVTFPLAPQLVTTTTSSHTPSLAIANTIPSAGAGVNGSNSAQQNYTIAPLNDANTLRNQQALYRHAAFGVPLIGNYQPPRIFFQNKFYDDPYPLQLPHCVLCAVRQGTFSFVPRPKVFENPILRPKWLFWESDPYLAELKLSGDIIDLGHFGGHELYMRRSDQLAGVLTEFVIHSLPNTEPAEVFTAPVVAVTEAPGVTADKGAAGRPASVPAASAPATNTRMQPAARQGPALIIPQQIQP
jgi:hypothetical protein